MGKHVGMAMEKCVHGDSYRQRDTKQTSNERRWYCSPLNCIPIVCPYLPMFTHIYSHLPIHPLYCRIHIHILRSRYKNMGIRVCVKERGVFHKTWYGSSTCIVMMSRWYHLLYYKTKWVNWQIGKHWLTWVNMRWPGDFRRSTHYTARLLTELLGE